MGYFYLRRTQLALACFLTLSLLLLKLPDIDLFVSNLFFDHGFFLTDRWWMRLTHHAVTYFLYISAAVIAGVYVYNRYSKRSVGNVCGKKVLYLFLVLAVGAGLVVNVALKDNFGRARPRDIQEFGGTKHFTPAFVMATECDRNCSFSSGHTAGAFFSLALAMALSRRRSIIIACIAFGTLVSFSRIASGAHFLSDTVVSFFVMFIVADVLHYYMVVPKPGPVPHPVPAIAPIPG
jgi:lipid A 4'-phosphatase